MDSAPLWTDWTVLVAYGLVSVALGYGLGTLANMAGWW